MTVEGALSKQIVVTIHGVNNDGQWQEKIDRVLAPHFDCKTVTYYGYDTILGAPRAVVNIAALSIALFVSAGVIIALFANDLLIAILLAVASLLLLFMSVFLARQKRRHYIDLIKQQIESGGAYARPHVVAHSLGTYLIGNVLRKFVDIHLGNVLLVSSVLPRNFPWQSLLQERPRCVQNVRNEFGTADWVTKLVSKLQWLVGDLGSSGAVGFCGDASVVHTSPSPLVDCVLCRIAPAKLHNVPLKEYGHSTQFLGNGHARKLWLPFLWGFSPEEFSLYLEMCQTAARLQLEERWTELDEIVAQLWASVFTWTNGKTLDNYLRDVIIARLRRPPPPPAGVDEMTEAVRTVLHIITDEACSEATRRDAMNEKVESGLHPSIAIVRAVEHIINEWPVA